jgi:hypothetical protein
MTCLKKVSEGETPGGPTTNRRVVITAQTRWGCPAQTRVIMRGDRGPEWTARRRGRNDRDNDQRGGKPVDAARLVPELAWGGLPGAPR